MNKNIVKYSLILLGVFLISCSDTSKLVFKKKTLPNIVLIFADDLGYGDLGCYGGEGINTPNIDRLGREGIKFTDFFVPANVCSPSRASILTGRYPIRNGYPIPINSTIEKYKNYGLHPDEITIAMFLKEFGYISISIGKWHLGQLIKGSHPLDKGFDESFGIKGNYAKYPAHKVLYHNRDTILKEAVFEDLTNLYTQKAVDYIHENKETPFFLYLSHHAVHTPIRPNKKFKGTSKRGAYGDFIHELDESTGRVLKAIKDAGIEENTLIIFTSDNGPDVTYVNGTSSGELSGGKYGTMEGGHRVPGMISWKGKIKPNQESDITITSMDLLPTISDILNAKLPADRIYDGKSILKILKNKSKHSPHKYLYYYNGINLQAVRKGNYKLHLPRTIDDQPFWCKNGKNKGYIELSEYLLFDLDSDVGEKINIANEHPEIVEELKLEANRIRKELGDVHVLGTDQREPPFENPQLKFN